MSVFDMGKNASTYTNGFSVMQPMDLEKTSKLMNDLADRMIEQQEKFNVEMRRLPCSKCGSLMELRGRRLGVCEHQFDAIRGQFPNSTKSVNLASIKVQVIKPVTINGVPVVFEKPWA